MPLGTEVSFGVDGHPALPPEKTGQPPSQFLAHVIVAKRLDGSKWHLARSLSACKLSAVKL